jgi:uncharacterized protein (DUF2267 family)
MSRNTSKQDKDIDAETVVHGVFGVLSTGVTEGESEDIKHILPPKRREQWDYVGSRKCRAFSP